MEYQEVLDFWFAPENKEKHFIKDEAFDEQIRQCFLQTHTLAHEGKLTSWRETPEGRLAEIIVLDQFSRNMFRDTPKCFVFDALALELSLKAIKNNVQDQLTIEQKAFLYMPLMHSESKEMHEKAVELYNAPGLENNYKFELMHKKIIDRFGRYPHRNEILGRVSTAEEKQFLKSPGSRF